MEAMMTLCNPIAKCRPGVASVRRGLVDDGPVTIVLDCEL
jgi:hypothetical protein